MTSLSFGYMIGVLLSWENWVGASLGVIAICLAKKTGFFARQIKARQAKGVNARKTMDTCAAAVSNMILEFALLPTWAHGSWEMFKSVGMAGIIGFLFGLAITSVIHSERMARWAKK